jgi:hypothetical protein
MEQQDNIVIQQLSQNYSYCQARRGESMADFVSLADINVCVLPFETESTGKAVVSMYLMRQLAIIKNNMVWTAAIVRRNDNIDENNYDTACRFIAEVMKLPVTSAYLQKMFYLGEIELNSIIVGSIPCYAYNVTGMLKEGDTSFEINSDMQASLEKVSYDTLLKSGSRDAIASTAITMLLSYSF